jgi:predicted nucleotidyltransferase
MLSRFLEEHRAQIQEIAAQHGARNVRVFGSLARGGGTADSDLDLLISLEKGRSLLDLVALKHELEDVLGRPVDVVTDRSLSPHLRPQVLREAVAL